jgi:hypothetical protein
VKIVTPVRNFGRRHNNGLEQQQREAQEQSSSAVAGDAEHLRIGDGDDASEEIEDTLEVGCRGQIYFQLNGVQWSRKGPRGTSLVEKSPGRG